MAFSPTLFLLGLPSSPGFIAAGGDAPVITSDGGGATAAVSIAGGTTVTTVAASGTGTKLFSLVGGAEELMFTINPSSGVLTFTTAPEDGEYEVVVAATSDWGYDTQTITVTVGEEAMNYLAVSVDLSSATWNTAALHTVFDVSGLVEMIVFIECTESLVGVAGSATLGVASQTFTGWGVFETDGVLTGQLAGSGTGQAYMQYADYDSGSTFFRGYSLADALGYAVTTPFTNGTLIWHCWWIARNPTGSVAAGDGSPP